MCLSGAPGTTCTFVFAAHALLQVARPLREARVVAFQRLWLFFLTTFRASGAFHLVAKLFFHLFILWVITFGTTLWCRWLFPLRTLWAS